MPLYIGYAVNVVFIEAIYFLLFYSRTQENKINSESFSKYNAVNHASPSIKEKL